MRYWDSSALVPLVISELTTRRVVQWLTTDVAIVTWWGSSVECTSAIQRRVREGVLESHIAMQAASRLAQMSQSWHEIVPDAQVRETAIRILQTHPLRAADALQLSAALVAAGGAPGRLEFACLDDRLREAAGHEGFAVL